MVLFAFTGIAVASTNSWSLRKWQMEDGLPNNTVTGIAQTPDGYLWIATPTRLARFDGATFETIPRERFAPSVTERISTLRCGRDGCLWLAVNHGPVIRIQPGAVQIFTNGLQNDKQVQALAEDGDSLWISYKEGLVCHLRHGQGHVLKASEGAPFGSVCSFATDGAGRLWYAKDGQFGIAQNDHFEPQYAISRAPTCLSPSHDGGIWICAGARLLKFNGHDAPRIVAQFHPDMPRTEPTVMIEDRNGGVWVGTSDNGLLHFADGQFENVPTSHRQILCLLEDNEGNIWAGTSGGGLDRIQREAISLEGTDKGLPFEAVQSICEDTNGTLWAVTQNGFVASRTNGVWVDQV